MGNCLGSEQGTLVWAQLMRSRQMLVLLEDRQALPSRCQRARDRMTVDLARLRGRANRETSERTIKEVQQL